MAKGDDIEQLGRKKIVNCELIIMNCEPEFFILKLMSNS